MTGLSRAGRYSGRVCESTRILPARARPPYCALTVSAWLIRTSKELGNCPAPTLPHPQHAHAHTLSHSHTHYTLTHTRHTHRHTRSNTHKHRHTHSHSRTREVVRVANSCPFFRREVLVGESSPEGMSERQPLLQAFPKEMREVDLCKSLEAWTSQGKGEMSASLLAGPKTAFSIWAWRSR